MSLHSHAPPVAQIGRASDVWVFVLCLVFRHAHVFHRPTMPYQRSPLFWLLVGLRYLLRMFHYPWLGLASLIRRCLGTYPTFTLLNIPCLKFLQILYSTHSSLPLLTLSWGLVLMRVIRFRRVALRRSDGRVVDALASPENGA